MILPRKKLTTKRLYILSFLAVCSLTFLLFATTPSNTNDRTIDDSRKLKSRENTRAMNIKLALHNHASMSALKRISEPYLNGEENFAKLYDFDANDPRPIMHTFFAKQPGASEEKNKEHIQMLAVWKETWSMSGWNPRILNISHAKQHPNYTWAAEQLDNIPMWNDIKGRGPDHYNRLCFLRHFAMPSVGGGWLSDYDTVPFNMDGKTYGGTQENPIYPNDGEFTSYQSFTPTMIVGNKTEWDRFALGLIYEGLITKREQFSDMLAQRAMQKKHQFIDNDRLDAPIEIELPYTKDRCDIFVNKTFIHFCHAGVGGTNRSLVVTEYLRQISEVCDSSYLDITKKGEEGTTMAVA